MFKKQQKQECEDCHDDCQSKQEQSALPTENEVNELKEITINSLDLVENPQKLTFKVEGMCCASEVESLKDVLNPLLKGREANLGFDLINAKLTFESKYDNLPTKEEIIKAVAKTGMTATLWNEHVTKAQEKKSFWQRYGHITMNVASAASLVVGFIIHAVQDGISKAFGGGIESGQETERPDYPPIATMVFYSTAIVAGSWFILPKAVRTVRRLRLDTNVLMLTATAGAVGINHWFEAASSMYLFSAAELLESWNMGRARKAISSLMELTPSTAQVINEEGIIIEQLVEEIPVGTMITVRPGGKIPMDSMLVLGSTYVNQAPITGESLPIQKDVGDRLFAGTINGDSTIQCRVTKLASDSTLASIIRKVEEAQSKRARSDQWIEKFSHYYVPSMLVASVVVCVVPPLATGGSWYPWIYKGLELLVISCPCSLVISTPVSIVAGLTAAARNGVLIKGGVYLETASRLKAFAMDKTGTLTTGEPTVQDIIPFNNYSVKKLLKLAVALEIHSDHPLARAIQHKAKTEGIIKYQPAERFQIFKGKGAKGYINGKSFWIGSHRFLQEKVGNNEPEVVYEKIKELQATGHSIVAIGHGKNIYGLISITDTVRPESKNAIQSIKRTGIEKVIMLTGDNEGAAKTIADSIGIDEYYAELLPEDKVKQVELLMEKYRRVAMVGDGVNDAPAMAVSSLGIAMGTAGSDAAIETADIALMSDDLGKLAWLVNHSQRTLNIIKQNVVFSLAVKVAFVGLTFANKSTLWMAMLSDMGASFIVVSNGLRLLNDKAFGCFGRLGRGTSQGYVFRENEPSSSQLLDIELLTDVEAQKETVLKLQSPSTPNKKEGSNCKKDCGGDCHTSTSKKTIDESKQLAETKGLIGPRKMKGWLFENVKDDGNCFYLSVASQLKAINHPFISNIPSSTASNDSLRLLIQGKRFKDKEWADYQEILRVAQKLKVIVAVVDTRHPDLGFVYHYTKIDDDSLDHTNDNTALPKNVPIIKLAFTGNHYLAVLKHPEVVQGQFVNSKEENTQISTSHQKSQTHKKVKIKEASLEVQPSKNKTTELLISDTTDDLEKEKSSTCKKSCGDTCHTASPDLNKISTMEPVIKHDLDKKLVDRLKNVQMKTSDKSSTDSTKNCNDHCDDKCNKEKPLTTSEKEVTPSLVLQFDQSRRRQSQKTVETPTEIVRAEELEEQIEPVKKSCCQSKNCKQ